MRVKMKTEIKTDLIKDNETEGKQDEKDSVGFQGRSFWLKVWLQFEKKRREKKKKKKRPSVTSPASTARSSHSDMLLFQMITFV